MSALLDTYDGLLLDAFGVLVDGTSVLPGAVALIAELGRRDMPFAIVSNDASRVPATFERRFASAGLAVPAARFVTSGMLLADYFRDRGLVGARTCVLGTADSYQFVREAGGVPIELAPGMAVDVVAICDDSGTPFLEGIELALSAIVRAVEAGRRPALVLPNPDLIYPKGSGELGVTAGGMAALIELALARRLPGHDLVFDHLGKPAPLLFLEAGRRLGVAPARLAMVGDQLETDILGAQAAGVDAALVTGISRWQHDSAVAPTYLLDTIEP
ncbi:MAG: Haloacid dehalogenase domain protein hydrolase [Deltaproteobacteria bacterium]|nr:Haloacid dehalogenase domain protein hydrolase [Deltaproteobacteria bacterium]